MSITTFAQACYFLNTTFVWFFNKCTCSIFYHKECQDNVPHLEQCPICLINPVVLCEDILWTDRLSKHYPEMYLGEDTSATRSQSSLSNTWVCDGLSSPDSLVCLPVFSHPAFPNTCYARSPAYMVSSTGRTSALMKVNFVKERDLKQIIICISIYLQIVLRKKKSHGVMRGYTRQPS